MAVKASHARRYPNALYVDTSAWFDYFVPGQPHSIAVERVLLETGLEIVTCDYVLDELLSLLKARRQYKRHAAVWKTLTNPSLVDLIHTSPSDIESAYRVYSRFRDKEWSFTDCVSYHHIHRLGISHACATDKHFHEFGIVTVMP